MQGLWKEGAPEKAGSGKGVCRVKKGGDSNEKNEEGGFAILILRMGVTYLERPSPFPQEKEVIILYSGAI